MAKTARVSLQPGLGDYLDRPVGTVRKFFDTARAFVTGDAQLLMRNSPYLSPPLYFAACIALAIAFLKSAWPDDPVKSFESPSYLKPLQLFLDFIPLPMFAISLAWMTLVSAPVFLAVLALGYPVRLSRVIAATVYTFATVVLLLAVWLFGRILSYDFFVGERLENLELVAGVWDVVGLVCLFGFYIPMFKLLGIAHGMTGYRFAAAYFIPIMILAILVEALTDPTSRLRGVWNAFTDIPVHLFQVPSRSMAPTLPVGTELVVNRVLPTSQLKAGDIVAFYVPKEDTKFIERIVGRGGDKIQMIGGALHVNGKPVRREPAEDWVGDGGDESGVRPIKRWKETLGGASYFTLDLVENGSLDDTPVYTVPAGHFFLLGDNRDNVVDSRDMKRIGFLPARNIVGKAYFVLYPRERGSLYKPP